jgi:hypothetical protein
MKFSNINSKGKAMENQLILLPVFIRTRIVVAENKPNHSLDHQNKKDLYIN